MTTEQIKALAEILAAHGLTALELCEGETKIRLEKTAAAAAAAPAPERPVPVPSASAPAAEPEAGALDYNNVVEVRSPIVGVFYAAPGPDAEPFVRIGSRVKKGDVLCIIETMKLMNEITSDYEGEIVDICVKNGDIAEFGQVLFKIF